MAVATENPTTSPSLSCVPEPIRAIALAPEHQQQNNDQPREGGAEEPPQALNCRLDVRRSGI